MDFAPAQDVVDQVADLGDGSPACAAHAREKVATATQGSYDALFDAALPGLHAGRALVALYACRLTPAPELADHYRARLANTPVDAVALQAVDHGDIDTLTNPRLHAILIFTRTLVERPIEGDRDALLRLPAAGLATADVVTLAQLIAFLSYQTRLVAGLRALGEAAGTGNATASTESAA
ncbi:CMD domain-containing protein [Cupriavidus basilensis]